MTKAELIEAMKDFPDDMEVKFQEHYTGYILDVNHLYKSDDEQSEEENDGNPFIYVTD